MKSRTSSRFASNRRASFLAAALIGDSAGFRLFALPPLLRKDPYSFLACPTPSSYLRRNSPFRRGGSFFLIIE